MIRILSTTLLYLLLSLPGLADTFALTNGDTVSGTIVEDNGPTPRS